MSRTTTILALLQTFLVIVGFFALGAVLKMTGYPESGFVRWNPLAVFLREHGLWLLLLPVIWVVLATSAQRLNLRYLSDRVALVMGLAITGITIALFFYAAVFHLHHPDPHLCPVIQSLVKLDIVQGDLLNQPVEVIVNAWNRNVMPQFWWLCFPQYACLGAIKGVAQVSSHSGRLGEPAQCGSVAQCSPRRGGFHFEALSTWLASTCSGGLPSTPSVSPFTAPCDLLRNTNFVR